jgi:hypothetical protein
MKEVSCRAGFLLGLFFEPEGAGELLVRNLGSFSTMKKALYPRRHNSS